MGTHGISNRAIRELIGVNNAFIALTAISGEGPCDRGRFGLDGDIVGRLRLMDRVARRRLADKPYALFSLRFHDIAGWDALLDQGVRDGVGVVSWPDDGTRLHQFLVMVLGAMREMAGREPYSASVLFGVPPALGTALSRAEIGTLPALAEAVSPWLRARCAASGDWWSEMIVTACARGRPSRDPHRGIHASLMAALDLRRARLPDGRLCRRL